MTGTDAAEVLARAFRESLPNGEELTEECNYASMRALSALTAAGHDVVTLPKPCQPQGTDEAEWWDTIRAVSIPEDPERKGVQFDGQHIHVDAARELAAALLSAASIQTARHDLDGATP